MGVSRQKNAAFTLVELLVVITILGMLMALLMPAVNSVRESMRRTQCKNNLKQIGTAANAHLTAYGFFPSGGWGMIWLGDPDRGTGASQPGSWIYQLLPYLGFDMIHDLGKGEGNGASGNFTSSLKFTMYGPKMKSSAIPLFICASRRRAILFPDAILQGSINAGLPTGLAHSDYCANTGTLNAGDAFGGPPLTCYSTFPNCAWDTDASTGNGVVYQASQVTPGAITDGLSHAFFAGEKSLDPPYYYNSEEAGDDNSMLEGFDHDIIRWCGSNYPPAQDSRNEVCTSATNSNGSISYHCPNDNSFGSAHSAGVNFVYCDGSVHLISYQINLTTYTSLGCINYAAANPGYTLDESYSGAEN